MAEALTDDPKAKAGKGAATDWVAAFAHGDGITAEATNTAHGAAAVMLKSDPYEYETEEERAKREHQQAEAMAGAVTNFRNAMYSLGSYNISYEEASNSLRGMEEDIDSSMEVERYFAEQTRNNVAYKADGTAMTRAEITAYESTISQCTPLSTEEEAARSAANAARLEANAAALKAEIARFNSGEITDISALSAVSQATIIEDRVKSDLAAGKSVNIADVPEALRTNAVNTIIAHHDTALLQQAVEAQGMDFKKWTNGEYSFSSDPAMQAQVATALETHQGLITNMREQIYRDAGLPMPSNAAPAVTVPAPLMLGALQNAAPIVLDNTPAPISSVGAFQRAATGNSPDTSQPDSPQLRTPEPAAQHQQMRLGGSMP